MLLRSTPVGPAGLARAWSPPRVSSGSWWRGSDMAVSQRSERPHRARLAMDCASTTTAVGCRRCRSATTRAWWCKCARLSGVPRNSLAW